MEWLYSLFVEHSALQAVIILSLISAIGLGLGKIQIGGVSLGVTFVFFAGILAGHFGFSVDPQMLNYAETFGLVIFVYALGLQVGPGFFSSFRKGGLTLNMLAIGVVLLGTLFAVIGSLITRMSLSDAIGVLCGATTNTPALGAAQQTLKQMGLESNTPALGCAVAYPLGVIGVILAILIIRKVGVRPGDLELPEKEDTNKPYIGAFQIHNPAVYNKSIQEIAQMSRSKFVISRLWREGKVSIPTSEKILKENDRLLVITSEKDAIALTVLFGEQETTDWNKEDIDWNAMDSQLVSQPIVITRPELNGKKIGALRLRNHYGVNISRVYRSGVQLLATSELRLQLGDRLTVIGEAAAIQNVEKVLGNAVKSLSEPNLVAVFVGIVLGLALGAIPFTFSGISTPVKLGMAGGPIVVGILIGTFGPRLHMITYTTKSANLMLRALGLSMYLACLGLDAGTHFFDTVFRPEGVLWIALGAGLTLIPTLIIGFVALKMMKIDFGTVAGMLCGSMANPMALNYANDTIPGDNPSVAYATVYPLSMFLRVIIAQLLLMFLL
ncbi:putative transporter [Bacteroides sp.]|uniref:putative transporter n=1 Tax=Bacteroides sp. TaxID=29523 RepID=UPI001B4BF369|nr:putative transporter [Bacteroides sp.]MBP6067631.1 putative transporter [Bacteroides sp.]MBP6936539.1 putative transporter [Bacteroides sp.]MBP9587147.1 putative transporter [Bacteroides sp.]